MAIDPNEVIWAPLPILLPQFVPVAIERGLPGYIASELAPGETRLEERHLKPVVVAATYAGALVGLFEQPLYRWSEVKRSGAAAAALEERDRDAAIWKAAGQLRASLQKVPGLDDSERRRTATLIDLWEFSKVIRSDTDMDEWLMLEWSEALLGRRETRAHSALGHLIGCCLHIRGTLPRMRLVWDDLIEQVETRHRLR